MPPINILINIPISKPTPQQRAWIDGWLAIAGGRGERFRHFSSV